MTAKKILAAHLLTILTLLSCKKEDTSNPGSTTSLTITVNSLGSPVTAGVNVTLYASSTDWENKTNAIGSKITDNNGTVIFTNLSPVKYYFFASSGCLNNGFNAVSTTGSITEK